MAMPYESTGRSRQKARTRAAMIAATRTLLAEGAPNTTVEQRPDRALVSRTTDYPFFPNQHALLLAAFPELDAPSLLGSDAPRGALQRLDLVAKTSIGQ